MKSKPLLLLLNCSILAGLAALIIIDSKPHFDRELVELKKKHHSAQRNWNVYFGQHNVYQSGGIKHENDFNALSKVLSPGSAVFTDLATSYYMRASLPVFVKNVHLHHGRYKTGRWHDFIGKGIGCYMDVQENLNKFKSLLQSDENTNSIHPKVRYIAINKTQGNINFSRDCLSQRRGPMISIIDQLGKVIYDGKTVVVYELFRGDI